MIRDYQKVDHIFIVCGKTDIRKGIDGLATIVLSSMSIIWMCTTMLFSYFVAADEIVSKCCITKKMVSFFYTSDWIKENFVGRSKKEIHCLTHQQIRWLLEGLSIDQPKAISVGKRGIF